MSTSHLLESAQTGAVSAASSHAPAAAAAAQRIVVRPHAGSGLLELVLNNSPLGVVTADMGTLGIRLGMCTLRSSCAFLPG